VTTAVACVVPQISVVMDFIGATLAGLQGQSLRADRCWVLVLVVLVGCWWS